MSIRDVLIGAGIAWLALTPEGNKVKDELWKKFVDTYMKPPAEKKEQE